MTIKLMNHFLKGSCRKTLPSPIYSIVYNGIPANRLMIKDEMVNATMQDREVKEVFSSYKDVLAVINDLIKDGVVVEYAGINLDKKLGL